MHNIDTPDLPDLVKDSLAEFKKTIEGAQEIQTIKTEERRSKMKRNSRKEQTDTSRSQNQKNRAKNCKLSLLTLVNHAVL